MATADYQSPISIQKRRFSLPPPPLSPSLSSTTSKRSPSPIVIASLSAENPKGVKNITRKVIKRLEGLGHLEMVDSDFSVREEEEELDEGSEEQVVQKAMSKPCKRAKKAPVNGNGVVHFDKKLKTDFEIPRKLLHSSIGFLTLYLYVSDSNIDNVVKSLWLALCIIVPADFLRFRSSYFERVYERMLGFLMRESEKTSINGVVWYILGVNFVLSFYPQDIATVAILILSWADTTASTFGRLYGTLTPKLPARVPVLGLPFASRKSLAGFIAASLTGALIATMFWGFIAPMRPNNLLTWSWNDGVRQISQDSESIGVGGGGALGLLAITVVTGLVSGTAEALELGSLDDNLTLPIISGGCILGFLKLLGKAISWFSS